MKKATFFMPLLLVVVLVALTWTYITMVSKHGGFSVSIGEKQGAILSAENRAEKALFYIDRSARYAAETAAFDLAENGGYYDVPECGAYLGVTIWNQGTKECWPETPDLEYARYFNDEIRERLAVYPDLPLAELSYDIVLDNRRLYAFSEQPIKFDIILREPDILPDEVVLKKQIIAKRLTQTYNPPPKVSLGQYAWPGQSTVITSCYGWRNIDYGSTEHRGIDIRAAVGDPVYAIAEGKARILNDVHNTLIIEHKGDLTSMYLHNSEILVLNGENVAKGQLVALAGKAGAKEPHIHLTIKKGKDYLDPIDPDNNLFDITKLSFTRSANCLYACKQYEYCDIMRERTA